MEHLTVEEIIEFVSFNELTKENIDLALKVNKHIYDCDECREKVSAFQTVYDEFCRLGNRIDEKEMTEETEKEVILKSDVFETLNKEETERF